MSIKTEYLSAQIDVNYYLIKCLTAIEKFKKKDPSHIDLMEMKSVAFDMAIIHKSIKEITGNGADKFKQNS